jgi:hypothetical protein
MNTAQRMEESRAIWEKTKEPAKKELDTELLKEMKLVDWAQATNEQHARRLAEHSALKKQVIMAVTEKLKRATALVDSLGKGELIAWTLEDKELVAPYAVELRHTLRRLVEHRVLPVKGPVEYVDDEPPLRAKPGTTVKYPEQILTLDEMEAGVKVQDISEGLEDNICKAKVRGGRTTGHGGEGGGGAGGPDAGGV